MAYTACVTGAAGFIGLELTKQLLERGWTVRATVRSFEDKQRCQPLHNLAAALPGKLELFQCDLLTPGDFDEALLGAHFLFHCASPFLIDVPEPQRQLVDPAISGARHALQAAAKQKASGGPLRRVVLTSSFAACKGRVAAPPKNGSRYTEEDWNESSTVANGEAYWAGKAQAERLAWRLAAELDLELTTICPEFVIGPPIAASLPDGLSVGFMKGWLQGTASTGACTFAPDVRDVARAHWLAALAPVAAGQRYIIANEESTSPAFISRTLSARFPEFGIPEGEECETVRTVDGSKALRELGLRLTPMDQARAIAV